MDGGDGTLLPHLVAPVPGPASAGLVDILARHECPGITARRARASETRGLDADPIVWARARGANVWDADGNRFVDLTSGFGVALIGHAHPAVTHAVAEQADTLLHGMGDVFPNAPRIRLMERLAARAPGDLSQCLLGANGSDAVEAALKTAALHSGRPGVLAFWGSYHGLSYGALAATAYKDAFRQPFQGQLGGHVSHLPYGEDLDLIARFLAGPATGGESIGAILVEPILGRGGVVEAPHAWLRGLRELADKHGAALIFDEIFSGLGRAGSWWACDHAQVVPDILCVGKALGGGMPISACVARPDVMDAWRHDGLEAIHTSTFLGHPVTAAAALASLDVLEAMDAPTQALAIEARVRSRLGDERVRGRGAMLGVELSDAGTAGRLSGELLLAGFISLPCGVSGDVLGLTPPLVITDEQLDAALDVIATAL